MRRSWELHSSLLLAALIAGASCGGGNGGGGGGGNGGGGAGQTAQACGGTLPDAQAMANWAHRQSNLWSYFIPNTNWQVVESTSGIDISSPIGDAIVEFAFAYGPVVPTTADGVEAILWKVVSNHQVVSQSQVVAGGPGQEQTIEFTGVWNVTGHNVHGIYIAGVGPQVIQAYLIMANVEVWAADQCTLTLIRNHITYL
jgi:hypothetical protein